MLTVPIVAVVRQTPINESEALVNLETVVVAGLAIRALVWLGYSSRIGRALWSPFTHWVKARENRLLASGDIPVNEHGAPILPRSQRALAHIVHNVAGCEYCAGVPWVAPAWLLAGPSPEWRHWPIELGAIVTVHYLAVAAKAGQ